MRAGHWIERNLEAGLWVHPSPQISFECRSTWATEGQYVSVHSGTIRSTPFLLHTYMLSKIWFSCLTALIAIFCSINKFPTTWTKRDKEEELKRSTKGWPEQKEAREATRKHVSLKTGSAKRRGVIRCWIHALNTEVRLWATCYYLTIFYSFCRSWMCMQQPTNTTSSQSWRAAASIRRNLPMILQAFLPWRVQFFGSKKPPSMRYTIFDLK